MFLCSFPTYTQLVRLFSKLPLGSYKYLKASDRCTMLRMDIGNNFIQRDVSLRAFGSKFIMFFLITYIDTDAVIY